MLTFFLTHLDSVKLSAINSKTRILLVEILSKFRMLTYVLYVFSHCKFKSFVFFAYLLFVSHSIDICTAATRNIRRAHTVSTNQIEDLLNFRQSSLPSAKLAILISLTIQNRSIDIYISNKTMILKKSRHRIHTLGIP